MADKRPIKARFSVGSPLIVEGLQEFEPLDTIPVSIISGLSSRITLELGNNSIYSLGDVSGAAPTNGQVLSYNSVSGNWEAVTPVDNDVAAVWGNITGTLSDQLDLQSVLNNKLNTSVFTSHASDTSIHFSVINGLSDVDVPAPTNGQVLSYNSVSGNWEAVTPVDNDVAAVWGNITGTLSNQTDLQNELDNKLNTSVFTLHANNTSIHFSVINGLSDVDVPAPTNGQVLSYNSVSGNWEAATSLNSDQLVKISANDTLSGYLNNKLTFGLGLTSTIQSPSANESLDVVADVYNKPVSGNTMPMFIDTTRANKELSVETISYFWAEANVGNNDWIMVQHASDAKSGYIMPFNATIVSIQMQCTNTGGATKDIRLYINNSNNGSIGQFTGNGEQVFVNTQLNIDLNSGDKIRLRGAPGQGTIQDTNVQLRIKWRA